MSTEVSSGVLVREDGRWLRRAERDPGGGLLLRAPGLTPFAARTAACPLAPNTRGGNGTRARMALNLQTGRRGGVAWIARGGGTELLLDECGPSRVEAKMSAVKPHCGFQADSKQAVVVPQYHYVGRYLIGGRVSLDGDRDHAISHLNHTSLSPQCG